MQSSGDFEKRRAEDMLAGIMKSFFLFKKSFIILLICDYYVIIMLEFLPHKIKPSSSSHVKTEAGFFGSLWFICIIRIKI